MKLLKFNPQTTLNYKDDLFEFINKLLFVNKYINTFQFFYFGSGLSCLDIHHII